MCSSKGMKRKRWAREGELVWAALEYPIVLGPEANAGESDTSIQFWPALIKEVRLKTEIKSRPQPNSVLRDHSNMDVDPSNVAHRHNGSPTVSGSKVSSEDEDPWIVEHSTTFLISLLAVSQVQVVSDSTILPYQAYAPADPLLQILQSFSIDLGEIAKEPSTVEEFLDFVDQPVERTMEERAMDRIAQFQPFAGVDDILSEEDEEYVRRRENCAARAYCVAIQIGSKLAMYWTPTDEYEFRISPGTNSQNVVLDGSLPRPAAVDNLRTRTQDGTIFTSGEGSSQVRFQGLWWGGERIWLDELVRLKIGRHQISSRNGIIKPPSKASKDTEQFLKTANIKKLIQEEEGESVEPSEDGSASLEVMGAASRGVFMRIDGIVMGGPSSALRELHLCGMLYELADDTLEADSVEEGKENVPTTSTQDVKGKGKQVPSSVGVPGNGQTPVNGSSIPSSLAERMKTFPRAHSDGSILTYEEAVSLSTPRKRSLPLPPAPNGYRFRPIIQEGFEAVVDITLLAGRYYPRILDNPLMLPFVAQSDPSFASNRALWALEGLEAGVHNSVDPTIWRPSRVSMMKDADKVARDDLVQFWRSKLGEDRAMRDRDTTMRDESALQNGSESNMEVDPLV
jgi:hypothetical protein